MIRGIMAFCRANPRWVIAVEPLWAFGSHPGIHHWDVDGLIVQTFSREFEDNVLACGLPATNVSNFCDHALRVPTVIPDDSAIGAMGAEYLLSLGFRDLAFCWPGNSEFGRHRLLAFQNTASRGGANVHVYHAGDVGIWLKSLPKPAAVMGCNDDWAHRVLNAAHHHNIKVPDEIAVIGVDDDELFNTLVTPSLSSVAVPAEQVGYEAAAMLDRLMDGKPLPEPVKRLAPIRIVARESTDVLTVGDQEVAMALRFISDNSAEPLQVDDILDHVPLSRRSLERRFQRAVGHSVSAAMRQAHVERAKKLLISTDMSMPAIATASGFTTATRLGIVFKKEVGVAPSEFRRRARIGGRG